LHACLSQAGIIFGKQPLQLGFYFASISGN